MVKVIITDDFVTFEIKNNGIKDLKNVYTIDYFDFMHIEYEIFVTNINSGGYVNRFFNVPFKQISDYTKGIKIKGASSMELIKNNSKPNNKIDMKEESTINVRTSHKKNPVYENEIILIKIKIDKYGKVKTLEEIRTENKQIYLDDNIEIDNNYLFYNDIESILRIQHYLKMDVFIEEIYNINGKYIIIKDNEIYDKNFNKVIDLSKIKNTLATKLYLH